MSARNQEMNRMQGAGWGGRRPGVALQVLQTVAAIALLGTACAEPEKEKLPTVTTKGAHAVALGATVQIVPMTINGTDTMYTFASDAPSIAKVDGMGLVTGVALGETVVVVTGVNSKASVEHPIVVVSALP
ncbi:MAG TPA: Ig-like domain-containing protein, partial [Polyangia bacterium]